MRLWHISLNLSLQFQFINEDYSIPTIQGNIQGLKPGQIASLERLYKRRFPKDAIYSLDQAKELAILSRAINRQLGLLLDRNGKVQMAIAGSATSILIPALPYISNSRLRGLRFLHTHLAAQCLDEEDLLDMLFLRFDNTIALTVNDWGEPLQWQSAWLLGGDPPHSLLSFDGTINAHSCYVTTPLPWHENSCEHLEIIANLETDRNNEILCTGSEKVAILISVSDQPIEIQEKQLQELEALCATAGIRTGGRLIQRRHHDVHVPLGKGKLAELEIMALRTNSELLIFDGELAPAQLHNLADMTERKVMDRTQLILDIFAQNAASRAGKCQVELAQLAYSLPRLSGGRKALDRLAGGIGGRGPGETLLELDRRKIRDRMVSLQTELKRIKKQRALARGKRERARIPVVALVGYTNAGKSTLLNALTNSSTLSADRMFATLDPVTRKLRFPKERSITLADTVGFIRNLPKELTEAFSATLEEVQMAEMLVHVADASHPDLRQQIAAVNHTLDKLGLMNKPLLLVLNKSDSSHDPRSLILEYPDAILVSATKRAGFEELLIAIENMLFAQNKS